PISSDTLNYIRDFYEDQYKREEINQEAFEQITENLPQLGRVSYFIKNTDTGHDSSGYKKEKEKACHCTNKKRKAEESEGKMLKHKEETPQNMSVEVNKVNGNISLQQTEQTEMDTHTQLAEVPVMDNKDTSKQSWAKMMDNDSDNLKDITNATNPWVTPSTNETHTEHTSTESDISHNKKEEKQIGLECLLDDCFFENINDMIG
ncbi:17858_t:CDS:2, partial [Gigaspora margarita]